MMTSAGSVGFERANRVKGCTESSTESQGCTAGPQGRGHTPSVHTVTLTLPNIATTSSVPKCLGFDNHQRMHVMHVLQPIICCHR